MPNPQPFSTWLAGYGGGTLDDKLTAALADVAADVRLLEKPGAIVLTLKFSPGGGGLTVAPSIAVKAPQGKEAGLFFYLTPDGSLSRSDPAQPVLPFTEPVAQPTIPNNEETSK